MGHRRQVRLSSVASRVVAGARRGLLLAVPLMVLFGCASEIPHPVASRTDAYCRECHTGRAGAPASHDKSGCVSCHEVGDTGAYPAPMPHRGGEADRCELCHADGTWQAPKTKHLGEADCYTCHQAVDYGSWPPAPPHEVADPEPTRCLVCHDQLDHADRPSCVACHVL